MLIERWHPVTSDMGLINAPVEQVVSGLVDWHASIGTIYRRRQVTASLADAFEALPPLSMEKRRRLFVATTAGWTACFQSGSAGSDPFPAMSFLAKRMGVLGMRVCSTAPGAMFRANVWEVYAAVEFGGTSLGYRRSIAAANDGGRWVFEESGERYPFEKPGFYTLTRKRDRFTRELLAEYLAHFGLEPFSDSFYHVSPEHPAVLLEDEARWPSRPPEFTLDEARVKNLRKGG
jgi:hypothetical protein